MELAEHSRKEADEIQSYVEELTAFGHRGSATSKEAEAAEWVISQLGRIGVTGTVQPFRGRTSWATSYLLHVSLAAAGAILLPILPWFSAGLAVVVLISLVGEHTTRWRSLRQLLGSSASRNVSARISAQGEVERRFLLVAHIDTQRTGLIWNEATQPLLFTATWLPIWLRSAFFPVTACLALQAMGGAFFTIVAGYRLAVALAGLLLVVYLICLALVVDWWRSPYVPGALDNASGVAAVLALAKRFASDPIPRVELRLLFTGCEESGLLGATAWAKEHRAESGTLTFINLDCVGVAPTRYFSQETPVVGPSAPYPPSLLRKAKEVAAALPYNPQPIALPGPTDGLPLLAQGFSGITVCGLRANGRMPNYHQMSDIAENVDIDGISRAVDFAWAFMLDPAQ